MGVIMNTRWWNRWKKKKTIASSGLMHPYIHRKRIEYLQNYSIFCNYSIAISITQYENVSSNCRIKFISLWDLRKQTFNFLIYIFLSRRLLFTVLCTLLLWLSICITKCRRYSGLCLIKLFQEHSIGYFLALKSR